MKYSVIFVILLICFLPGCSGLITQPVNINTSTPPTYNQPPDNFLQPSVTANSKALIIAHKTTILNQDLLFPPNYGVLLNDRLYEEQGNQSVGVNLLKIYQLEGNILKILDNDVPRAIENVQVSPNSKYIVFQQYNDASSAIVVIDSNGNDVYYQSWSVKEAPILVGWLDNERIIFGDKSLFLTPLATKVINIFQKDELYLDPNVLPDIYHGGNNGKRNWKNYSLIETVYSPDLNYIVYPSIINKNGGIDINLWDRKNSQLVTQIEISKPSEGEPVWSPSIDQFIIERNGLIAVSTSGKMTTLFSFQSIPDYEAVYHYRWSPDGTKIAMWLWMTNENRNILAIFDIKSSTLNIYSIYQSEIGAPPFWAPDGRFLLINGNETGATQQTSNIIILEISTNNYFQVPEKSSTAGWILSDK